MPGGFYCATVPLCHEFGGTIGWDFFLSWHETARTGEPREPGLPVPAIRAKARELRCTSEGTSLCFRRDSRCCRPPFRPW